MRIRRSPKWWMACVFGAGLAGAWPAPAGQAPPPPEAVAAGLEDLPAVVAKVEDHPVTRNDLVRELVGSAAPQALDRIARRMLVEQAAAKAGVVVTEEELDAQVKLDEVALSNSMLLAPWEVGDKNFEALVKARFRMSLPEYRAQVARQTLLARRLVGQDVRPTDAQLRKFFAENQDRFQPRTRYRAAHILITPLSPRDLHLGGRLMSDVAKKERLAEQRKGKEKWLRDHGVNLNDAPEVDTTPEWEQSRRRALQCLEDLTKPRLSWEQAVERYTQDPHDLPSVDSAGRPLPPLRKRLVPALSPGEVGWYTQDGPMVKEFYQGTKELKPGQLSGVIRTAFGYHIVKMLEVTPAEQKTYEQLRPRVEKTYADLVIRARMEQWLEGLVKDADVQSNRVLLWPANPAAPPEPGADPDPLVGRINGAPIRRAMVWRELIRSEGPDALDRLINREAALGPLRRLGSARLEWLSRPPNLRPPEPPPANPIQVSDEEVFQASIADHLRLDSENEALRKRDPRAAPRTFDQYLYEEYGQTPEDYRRSLTAAQILLQAMKREVQVDDATLQMEFALAQENYREPAAFEVSHILVAVAPGAGPEAARNAQELARQMRQQLLDGNKTWEDLVVLSQDDATKDILGSLGRLGQDTKTWPELYAALAAGNYEKGQLPEPLRTRQGFHVVRVERRHPERIPEFREVRDRVERDYLAARGALQLDVWLRAMQHLAKVKRMVFQVDTLLPPDYFPPPEQ